MATEKTTLEKFKEVIGDKLKDIKQLFDIPAIEPVTEVALMEMKTSDGQILRMADMNVGSKVSVISADGETPADGAYTLEDGTAITAKAGVIEAVTPAAEKPATEDPAKMNELAEVKESVKSITYKYSEMEKALYDSIKENSEAFLKVTKENEKLSAQNKAMFSLIEQIAELPTEEPAQKPKEPTSVGALAEFRAEVKAMKASRRELRN